MVVDAYDGAGIGQDRRPEDFPRMGQGRSGRSHCHLMAPQGPVLSAEADHIEHFSQRSLIERSGHVFDDFFRGIQDFLWSFPDQVVLDLRVIDAHGCREIAQVPCPRIVPGFLGLPDLPSVQHTEAKGVRDPVLGRPGWRRA